MDKYIYIGSYCPEQKVEELIKKGSSIDFAGNALQKSLIKGFTHYIRDIKVLSSWRITTYPKVKQLFFKKEIVEDNSHTHNDIRFVGVFNIPVFNILYKFWQTRKELKSLLSKEEDNIVIVYGVHTPFLLAPALLRNKIKKICVIVPDLPEYMSGKTGFLRGLLKKIDHNIINYCLKKIDCYALLSEHMKERLPMDGKKWVVMEGIFGDKLDVNSTEKEPHKTIMYTGNIFHRRGVDTLLEAFKLINDDDYRLWIRGNGDLKEEIIELSKQDKRVVYFEPMSRQELLKLEQRATVMINPTPKVQEFTRYFFPSKTMEYLASGTPTIMYRLDCMPKEYDSHLFYIDGNSVEDLKNKILEICEKPESELKDFGEKASEFILNEKTPEKQCSKILNLLNSI